MAPPIEMEYGRVAKVGETQIFIHDDSIGAEIVEPEGKGRVDYRVNWGSKELIIKLQGECPSEDNGAFVRFKLQQFRFPINRQLAEGTISLSEGEEVSRIVAHTNEKRLIAGFRVKHVKPTEENTDSQ